MRRFGRAAVMSRSEPRVQRTPAGLHTLDGALLGVSTLFYLRGIGLSSARLCRPRRYQHGLSSPGLLLQAALTARSQTFSNLFQAALPKTYDGILATPMRGQCGLRRDPLA